MVHKILPRFSPPYFLSAKRRTRQAFSEEDREETEAVLLRENGEGSAGRFLSAKLTEMFRVEVVERIP